MDFVPSRLDAPQWSTLHDRIDRVVSDAAAGYLEGLRRRGYLVDPLAWTRELGRLSRGRDVDYGLPGLPLMYAVRYMPKRVMSLVATLSMLPDLPSGRHVIDIGSGTGAVPVAFQLLSPGGDTSVEGVDASSEMIEFARQTQRTARRPAVFIGGTLDEVVAGSILTEVHDMVTFSAPFARNFEAWKQLVESLTSPGVPRVILASEPDSRGFLLDAFERALRARGWETAQESSDAFPPFVREVRSLSSLTRFWRKLGSPGDYQPQTWWEPPKERFLLARNSAS